MGGNPPVRVVSVLMKYARTRTRIREAKRAGNLLSMTCNKGATNWKTLLDLYGATHSLKPSSASNSCVRTDFDLLSAKASRLQDQTADLAADRTARIEMTTAAITFAHSTINEFVSS